MTTCKNIEKQANFSKKKLLYFKKRVEYKMQSISNVCSYIQNIVLASYHMGCLDSKTLNKKFEKCNTLVSLWLFPQLITI